MIPIFIIGAPRSGTNILRDTITSNEDYITWDCDEINYIWRYGHPFKKDDILNISDLNNKNSNYIKNKFSETTTVFILYGITISTSLLLFLIIF